MEPVGVVSVRGLGVLGFGVQGLGFRVSVGVWGLGFRVWGFVV